MEISTEQLIFQVEHLVDCLESNNPEIQLKINNIRDRVKALVHLCEVGHDQAARFGLHMLGPEIDAVVLNMGEEETVDQKNLQ